MMLNLHFLTSHRSTPPQIRFRDVSPSPAASAELWWYFNEAEIECDYPSNYTALIARVPPGCVEIMEFRAEALHAARKIADRLRRLRMRDALLLSGLYTERLWSNRVLAALPGGLAGAAEASPHVRAEYACALDSGRTRARSVVEFIEDVVRRGPPELVAGWRTDLEIACAIALLAYDRVRGDGASVVPSPEDA